MCAHAGTMMNMTSVAHLQEQQLSSASSDASFFAAAAVTAVLVVLALVAISYMWLKRSRGAKRRPEVSRDFGLGGVALVAISYMHMAHAFQRS